MFNKKNDPLVESVKAVMKQNEVHRQIEAALNEELGISSKRALPHEYHAQYDALLEAKRNVYHADEVEAKRGKSTVGKVRNAAGELAQKVRTNAEKLVDRFHAKRDAKRDVRAANKDNRPPSMEEEASNRATEGAMKSFLRRKAASKRAERENMSESVIAEIRENLEANLMAIHESGDDELFENYVNSLTEEELEILGLNERVTPEATAPATGPVLNTSQPDVGMGFGDDKKLTIAQLRARSGINSGAPGSAGDFGQVKPVKGTPGPEAPREEPGAQTKPTPPAARPARPAPAAQARPAPAAQARPAPAAQARPAPERNPFGDNTSGGSLSNAGYRTPPSVAAAQARGAAGPQERPAPTAARPAPTAARPAPTAARPAPTAARPATPAAAKTGPTPKSDAPATGLGDPVPEKPDTIKQFEPQARPRSTAPQVTAKSEVGASKQAGVPDTRTGSDRDDIPAPKPAQERMGTSGAFGRAAKSADTVGQIQPGETGTGSTGRPTSDVVTTVPTEKPNKKDSLNEQVKPNNNRSLQIKESLESFVRNRFLKG